MRALRGGGAARTEAGDEHDEAQFARAPDEALDCLSVESVAVAAEDQRVGACRARARDISSTTPEGGGWNGPSRSAVNFLAAPADALDLPPPPPPSY